MVFEGILQFDGPARARARAWARARGTCQTARDFDRASLEAAKSSSSSHSPVVELSSAHRLTAACD
jgi:hypothetical protein